MDRRGYMTDEEREQEQKLERLRDDLLDDCVRDYRKRFAHLMPRDATNPNGVEVE